MEISDYLVYHKPVFNIVTAMREPIARNISAFFQNLDPIMIDKANINELIKRFMDKYPHHLPLTWFDEQIKHVFGIDIFKYPFNRKRGWDKINADNIKCLLITVESNDQEKLNAINNFFKLKLKELKRTNVGKKKQYADIYKKFIKALVIPIGYQHKMIDNPIVKHFYAPSQINDFYKRWKKV
jgi:hypothetical protein